MHHVDDDDDDDDGDYGCDQVNRNGGTLAMDAEGVAELKLRCDGL